MKTPVIIKRFAVIFFIVITSSGFVAEKDHEKGHLEFLMNGKKYSFNEILLSNFVHPMILTTMPPHYDTSKIQLISFGAVDQPGFPITSVTISAAADSGLEAGEDYDASMLFLVEKSFTEASGSGSMDNKFTVNFSKVSTKYMAGTFSGTIGADTAITNGKFDFTITGR